MLKDPGNTLAKAQRIDLSKPARLSDRIGGTDLLDTYRFRLSSSSQVNLKLQGLQRNADVALLDGKGQILDLGSRPGKRNEVLSKFLSKGTYFIQVLGRGASTTYQLRLTAVKPGGGNGGNGGSGGSGGNGGGNTAPNLTRNAEFTATRATSTALSSAQLQVTDREQSADKLIYTLTKATQNGKLQRNGTVLGAGDRFTQADIDNNLVTYQGLPGPTKIAENLKGVTNLQRSGNNFLWTTLDTNTYSLFYKNGSNEAIKLQEGSIDPKASLSGTKVVWQGKDAAGTDSDIFFFDNSQSTGATPTITNLSNDDFSNANAKISGDNIIWETEDTKNTTTKDDDVIKLIYKSVTTAAQEITSVGLKSIVLESQKTLRSQIDGTGIVWEAKVAGASQSQGSVSQIFFKDAASTSPAIQLTDTQFGNQAPQISASKIVWNSAILSPPKPGSLLNLNSEIFWRDRGETGQIINLSNDLSRDTSPVISGSTVVWVNTSESNVTSLLYSDGTTKSTAFTAPKKLNALALSGNTLVWTGTSEAGSAELYSYDGQKVVRLTQSDAEERAVSLDGTNLFWESKTGDNVTLYAGDLASGGFSTDNQDSFDFTVTDGNGGSNSGTLTIKLS